DDRDQQLVRRAVLELGRGVRVGAREAREDLGALLRIHRLARARSRCAARLARARSRAACAASRFALAVARAATRSILSRARRARRRSERSRAAAARASSQIASPPIAATIAMHSTGQGGAQSSQPVQSSVTTVCIWPFAPMIASTGH